MKSLKPMKCEGIIRKLALCILLLHLVQGYPSTRKEKKTVESEEKQFPNGTVIGKYAYLDKEGNPVQVKYYADDSSYGVELNSYRLLQHKDGTANSQIEQQAKKIDEGIPSIPLKDSSPDALPKDGAFDTVDAFKYPALPSPKNLNVMKPEYPDYKEPLRGKNIYQKSKYNPDFEVYSKDDLDDGQMCGAKNEKVRVYNFVKEARKARQVPKEEEPQFCEF